MQTNDKPLVDLMRDIHEGRIQLPDFQRGWIWDDNRIRGLIASITRGFPVGAAMFLSYGGDSLHFKYRLFEGISSEYHSAFGFPLTRDSSGMALERLPPHRRQEEGKNGRDEGNAGDGEERRRESPSVCDMPKHRRKDAADTDREPERHARGKPHTVREVLLTEHHHRTVDETE